ncbi:MAG: hypothetical protein EOM20_19620 [Spartobacteria bacterium]|nr:hypothetical protein [Spartobacteria bacterium]
MQKNDKIEVEVLPPESTTEMAKGEKRNAVSFFVSDGDPVVCYHLAAEHCGNLSVWCAAMSGAELIKKKKECKRGEFGPYKETLPFSARTAENYMNLAQKLDKRLKALPAEDARKLMPAIGDMQHQAENMLALLNLPSPMDMLNPAHEQIANVIRKITNEQTLRQLYFDWDIVKEPKKLGGARDNTRGPIDPVQAAAEQKKINEDFWLRLIGKLEIEGITAKSWTDLDKAQRKQLLETCVRLNKLIRETF